MADIWPTETLDVDLMDESEDNPNQMSEDEFSALVEEIQENGFSAPVQVVGPMPDGRYTLFGGHHRRKAAVVLGMTHLPAVVVPPDRYTEDIRKIQLVKQNVLHGKLNPERFTKLYNELANQYDPIMLQKMMGFTKEDAFKKVYEDARKALPPEMQSMLDDTREEIKTVDDLSKVLNRLFAKHGNTLDANYMVFTMPGGGSEAMMVQVDKGQYRQLKILAEYCQENSLKMNEEMFSRLTFSGVTKPSVSTTSS